MAEVLASPGVVLIAGVQQGDERSSINDDVFARGGARP